MTFINKDSLKREVRQVWTEILGNMLYSVMDNWIRRLQQYIELIGDYVF
jgi:hypothetical protein